MKVKKEKNKNKINSTLTQKINENVEMNEYKNLLDDCKYYILINY